MKELVQGTQESSMSFAKQRDWDVYWARCWTWATLAKGSSLELWSVNCGVLRTRRGFKWRENAVGSNKESVKKLLTDLSADELKLMSKIICEKVQEEGDVPTSSVWLSVVGEDMFWKGLYWHCSICTREPGLAVTTLSSHHCYSGQLLVKCLARDGKLGTDWCLTKREGKMRVNCALWGSNGIDLQIQRESREYMGIVCVCAVHGEHKAYESVNKWLRCVCLQYIKDDNVHYRLKNEQERRNGRELDTGTW